MIKKLVKVAVIVVVASYIVSETKAGSHFRAWVERQYAKMEKKVTPDQELARIKNEVKLLDGDVDKVKGDLAESNVNVRLLRREVEELRAEVKDSEAAVRKHGEVVKAASANDTIQWGYRTVSFVDAKDLLQAEVKRHNDVKARLKAREASLASQEQTRDLVEQQLQEMLKQKDELASAVEEMEAEIKLAKVEQIRSKHQDDGSRMADIKSSLTELRKRVLVQREKVRIADSYTKSPAAEKSVEEILAGLDGKAEAKRGAGEEVKIVTKP
jgi:chromosome segregation ATPase